MITAEKMKEYLDLHGHIPWTVTIADALEAGMDWDKSEIVQVLLGAQDKIDALTKELKEKQNAK
jgi:hypothetical protein